MNILVTGGTGYIGSHTVVELIKDGHAVTIVDNLSNGSIDVIDRLMTITGVRIPLHTFDLQDTGKLEALFSSQTFDAVMHFAGLKAVGESVKEPLLYYRTNIDSTLTLLEVMRAHSVRRLIFSSSATVYGSAPIPYSENGSIGVGIANPYGKTKYMIEQILEDYATANPSVSYISLRYFNPIGAHESGRIGERATDSPNNLMPHILRVASGAQTNLKIYGNDYSTVDGTCVRDFLHVVDVAKGHVAALNQAAAGFNAFNLGSGDGTSVLELIRTFESVNQVPVPYTIAPRRAGDLAEYYADASKANTVLGWHAEKTLEDMCRDAWHWQTNN